MKKLLTLAMALMLATTLSFAQAGGGSTGQSTNKADAGKKEAKTSKAHKGGKKSKKGATTSTTSTPK